jgi:hypothetical protein
MFVSLPQPTQITQLTMFQMVIADQSPEGVFDPKCLQLALWHNIAVDAPKTGKLVPASDLLNVSDFPDHMCRASASNVYPSKKVRKK